MLLGADFLYEHGIVIDFVRRTVRTENLGAARCYPFQEEVVASLRCEGDANPECKRSREQAYFSSTIIAQIHTGDIRAAVH
jgi:hypothetical protein